MLILLVNAANSVSLRSENGISFFMNDLHYNGAKSFLSFLYNFLQILLQYMCTQQSHQTDL